MPIIKYASICALSAAVLFTNFTNTVMATSMAQEQNITKPADINPEWKGLLGEYGPDDQILYILEKGGNLHVLSEGNFDHALKEQGPETFTVATSGKKLTITMDDTGLATAITFDNATLQRRLLNVVHGEVFQITPQKPMQELISTALAAKPPKENKQFRKSDLVDLTDYSDTIKLDIRYATNQNFLGEPIYASARAFMQRPAAEAISRISKKLNKLGYGILVHDAYRPWYVSKVFWDATPEDKKIFVADPNQGSRHNRGAAIDMTLYDLKTGEPIDMVAGYDEMSPRSYPHYPGGSSLQRWHRELLRTHMEADGFTIYDYEWWHFDFKGWENYEIGTKTFEELE